jgi:WD40 repeat protein
LIQLPPVGDEQPGFTSLVWSPDGGHIAVVSNLGTIYMWDTFQWQMRAFQVPESTGQDLSIAWSPDSSKLAALRNYGSLLILDVADRPRVLAKLEHGLPRADNRRFRTVAWSPDGRQIACSRGSSQVMIWRNGNLQPPLEANHVEVTALAWSHDSTRLASGDNYGTLTVWG